MSLALHQLVAEAEAKGEIYRNTLAQMLRPSETVTALPRVVESVNDSLSDLIAENDAEAVGVVILAAYGAFRHRIATGVAYGKEDKRHLPSNREAADDALAQLVLKRYKAGKP